MALWDSSVAVGDTTPSFALGFARLGTGRARVGAWCRTRSSHAGVGASRGSRNESRVRPRVCSKARCTYEWLECNGDSGRCGDAAFCRRNIFFGHRNPDASSLAFERVAGPGVCGNLASASAGRSIPRLRHSGWVDAPGGAHPEYFCALGASVGVRKIDCRGIFKSDC